jgi:hypothetical protein
MNLTSLAAAIFIFSTASASAITEADIASDALVGKTLRFATTSGLAPLPASGVWTGTFAASGDGFTVADVSSGTPATNTTYSASFDNGVATIYLAKFGVNQDIVYLYLYFVKGVATYTFQAFSGASEGTFSIDPAVINGPEIDVKQSKSRSLTDGVSRKSFGSVKVAKTGIAERFVIKNTGTVPLSNLAITLDGKSKTEFIISRLKETQLAAGGSVEFTVKFKPTSTGTRKASLHIKSNDADESPFDIALTGIGRSTK